MAGKSRDASSSPSRRELTLDDYYQGVRCRNVAVLARALTLIESNNPRHQIQAEQLLERLLPHTGASIRVGITGAPGAGKSTFIEALGLHLVHGGKRVAVLAVDPSSGVTGGSILGDKTRMTGLSAEQNAFIRPSPSAGTLGGVARKTRESMLVCEAADYDVVLIETVGVGQSETMVAQMTDCFLALMIPGAGDELQGIKRGLLELVDIIAVNKADGATRAAAELAARQYDIALKSLAGRAVEDAPEVLTCSALNRKGIKAIWDVVARRHTRDSKSGDLTERRRRQNLNWLWAMVEGQLLQSVKNNPQVRAVQKDLELHVLAGKITPEAAARRVLKASGLPTDKLA